MGIWEWIYSPINAVKQNTPDITPVTDVCRKTYDICRDSTVHVAGKARDFHGYLCDDQVRDNLSSFAVNVSKHSALYIARSYGCGPIIDIVSRSVQGKKADSHKGKIEEFETKLAKLEEELSSTQLEIQRLRSVSKSQDESNLSTTYQRPEDVLNMFMMERSLGRKLFDNLIIPVDVGSERKGKTVSSTDGNC
ncbi:uncharacterized protein LOC110706155 [Chenopodium quinoa]|uniref:uncharacterized protein LOC110706155 n=1 Tax=Chenopodium quinoa TaxID=63459 RepID=UPI000B7779BD|nr:uncharacterized protein LOC110706155 [Chenopodium quinoa]